MLFLKKGFLFDFSDCVCQHQHDQQRGKRHHDRVIEQRVREGLTERNLFRLGFRHSVPCHKQPVGIESVGRAGDKRAKVLSPSDAQGFGFVRHHHCDALHLVGEAAVERRHREAVARLHMIQILGCFCYARVPLCQGALQRGALRYAFFLLFLLFPEILEKIREIRDIQLCAAFRGRGSGLIVL